MYKVYRILRKNILFILLAILLFSIFVNIPIWLNSKGKIFYSLEKIPKADIGILLGTSRYISQGNINLFYKYRIDAAEKLLKSGKIKKIILSGSKDEGYDEVEWMKNDLLKKGIKIEKIILDKKGNRTKDSIDNAIKSGYSNFIIISQKFHLERAIFLSSLSGMVSYGFAAESPDTVYSSKIYFREIFARIKLIFKDILFG